MKHISILLIILLLTGCSINAPSASSLTTEIITKIPEATTPQVIVKKSEYDVLTMSSTLNIGTKNINLKSNLDLVGVSFSSEHTNPNLVGSLMPHIVKLIDPESKCEILIQNYSNIDTLVENNKKIKDGNYKGNYYVDSEDEISVFRHFSSNKQIIKLSLLKNNGIKPKAYKATFDKLMLELKELSDNMFSDSKTKDKFIDVYIKNIPIIATSVNLFDSIETLTIGASTQLTIYTTYGFPVRINVNKLVANAIDEADIKTELGPYKNFKAYELMDGTISYIVDKYNHCFLGNIYYEGASIEVEYDAFKNVAHSYLDNLDLKF